MFSCARLWPKTWNTKARPIIGPRSQLRNKGLCTFSVIAIVGDGRTIECLFGTARGLDCILLGDMAPRESSRADGMPCEDPGLGHHEPRLTMRESIFCFCDCDRVATKSGFFGITRCLILVVSVDPPRIQDLISGAQQPNHKLYTYSNVCVTFAGGYRVIPAQPSGIADWDVCRLRGLSWMTLKWADLYADGRERR